jgi:hypothetical protein
MGVAGTAPIALRQHARITTLAQDVLFAASEPYGQGRLDIGDGHVIHFEQCGNPAGLPVVVLHGRCGIVNRPENAWRLHQAMPHGTLRIVDEAGDDPFEPAMAAAMVAAADRFPT